MFELEYWQGQAAELQFPTQALIGGQWRPALSGQTFTAINPATGGVLAEVSACAGEDVDAAVSSARQAFDAGVWAQRSPGERKQVLLRLADLLMAHREELALLDSLNMGKPVMDAWNIDVPGAAGVFRWYAESIDKLYDQVAPSAPNVLATITREALGVVAAEVGLTEQMAEDVIAGFQLDAEDWRPRTEADMMRYCYHVAGAVGVMMAVVMGAGGEEQGKQAKAFHSFIQF